jgi:hypothetical protein
MGHLRRGLNGGKPFGGGFGMGGILGPLAGLFGMGGAVAGGGAGGGAGVDFRERQHAHAGGGAGAMPAAAAEGTRAPRWRGEYAGTATPTGRGQPPETPRSPGTTARGGSRSYAAERETARREGAGAFLRRRGAPSAGVFADPSAGPAVGEQPPAARMNDEELARMLQAEEDEAAAQ